MKAKIKFGVLGMLLSPLLFAACEKETGWMPQNNERGTIIKENGGPGNEAKNVPLWEYKEIILYPKPKLPIPDPGPVMMLPNKKGGVYLPETPPRKKPKGTGAVTDPEPDPWKK